MTQGDIFEFLKKNKEKRYTREQIAKELDITVRQARDALLKVKWHKNIVFEYKMLRLPSTKHEWIYYYTEKPKKEG